MRLSALTLVVLVLAGCAVQKTLVASGGSRSDGIVKMSYEYGQLEAPQVDLAQGAADAGKRCDSWGYHNGAEPFGLRTTQCEDTATLGGCIKWLATIEYQCRAP